MNDMAGLNQAAYSGNSNTPSSGNLLEGGKLKGVVIMITKRDIIERRKEEDRKDIERAKQRYREYDEQTKKNLTK